MTIFAVIMIPERVRQIRTSENWFEKIGLSIVLFIYSAFFFMLIYPSLIIFRII